MAGEDKVHFFDISSTLPEGEQSWAPNPLRTRTVLNYKKIPYTQSYISPPDIEPLLKSLNVSPSPKPAPIPYTLPAIRHKPSLQDQNPASATINGTWAVAEHLERTFPAPRYPSIYPSNASKALAIAVGKIVEGTTVKGNCIIAPKVLAFLDDRGKEHMNRTRKEMWGKTPGELVLEGDELEEAWKGVEGELGVLAEMLGGSEGPFFEDDTVGYADLIVLAWLRWILATSESDFARCVSVKGGELRRLWEAGKQWAYGQGEGLEYNV